MDCFVPYDASGPKTRLSTVLDDRERRAFSHAMLRDVVSAIETAGHEATVISTDTFDLDVDPNIDTNADVDANIDSDVDVDAAVTVDKRPLSTAVNGVLESSELPCAILMADLALIRPTEVERLISKSGPVVLAPGLGGGTNALLVRDPTFRVSFHDGSFRKHLRRANEIGGATVIDSFRLAVDIDQPDDLAEVLIHGTGEAADWLREAGFRLDRAQKRSLVVRD